MSTDSYFSYKVFVIYSGKTLAFTTAFFTALPTMIAITIFAASPGRYGITPAYNPCTNVKCICAHSQIVPNAYVTAVQSTIPITAITMFPENFSTKNPLINAKKINPTKYPPVGPASLASPPLNPENTGSPTAPIRRYTR